MALFALACTLSSTQPPPTLLPRMTDTPQPTIAYATLSPQELPQSSSPVNPLPSSQGSLNALLAQVMSDRMMIDIDTLQNFGSRHVNSTDQPNRGKWAAYRYILSQFQGISAQSSGRFQVFEHPFTADWEGIESQQINIVGMLPGSEVGGGIILVGAHYDSIVRGQANPDDYAPGANDNGSGVAAMLELARILSQRQHRATIMFVAFAAEEVGRQGSIAFVDFLRRQAEQSGQGSRYDIRAMFSLDIIGSHTGPNGEINDTTIRLFSDGPNDGPPSPSRQLARAVQFINQRYNAGFSVSVEPLADRQGRYSDHLSFSEVGYPAARFIEPIEDLSRQHTALDTIDDVQASYLRKATQTTLAAITALADGPPPPQNISLRPNPDGTRKLVWEPSPGAARYIIALRRPDALIFNPAESFEWVGNTVDYAGWNLFSGLVIFSVDANGLIGPPSPEFVITPG